MSSGRVKVTLSAAIAELGSNALGVVALGEKVCVADQPFGSGGPFIRVSTLGQAASSIFFEFIWSWADLQLVVVEDRYQSNIGSGATAHRY